MHLAWCALSRLVVLLGRAFFGTERAARAVPIGSITGLAADSLVHTNEYICPCKKEKKVSEKG